MKITVTLIGGSKVVHSSDLNSVVIGRSEVAQFKIPDSGLSRQHALIENEGGSFFVTDLRSSNGVFIDGQRIEAGIKTPFSSFQTLSLGPLECLVIDNVLNNDEPAGTSGPLHGKPFSDQDNETRTRIMFHRKDAREALKKQKRNESSMTLLIIFIICGGGFYYFKMADNSRVEKPELAAIPIPASQVDKGVELPPALLAIDEFLEQGSYAERFDKKTCKAHVDICADLDLDEKDFEGIVERDKEFFIFMKNTKRNNDVFAAFDSDPTKGDIISVYMILKSNLYNLLMADKTSQIHLILLNSENKLYKVYRFHKKHLGKSRMELLTEIRAGIMAKTTDKFWALSRDKISFKDFTF